MIRETFLVNGFLPGAGNSGKHSRMCDFVPLRNIPELSEREGGNLEFSYLKNSYISESGRACNETNICVTTAADALQDASLAAPLDKLTGGFFKNV